MSSKRKREVHAQLLSAPRKRIKLNSDAPLSGQQAKAVKKIAKKVVRGEEETKVGYFLISSQMKELTPITWNYIYSAGISQGTAAESGNIIGNRFNMVGLKVRGTLYSLQASGYENQDVLVTVAIVESDVYKTNTSLANSDLFSVFNTYPERFDSSKVRVLGKQQFRLVAQIDSIKPFVPFEMYVPYRKKMELSYTSEGSYVNNGKNIYVVALSAMPNGVIATSNTCYITGVGEMFYKDS